MDKDKNISKPAEAIVAGPPKDSFRGYSMSELRYQRALTALQMEFCKSKIVYNYNKARKHKFVSFTPDSQSWVGKLLSGLHYTDYFLLGISAFTTVRKVMRFIGGKNKKK